MNRTAALLAVLVLTGAVSNKAAYAASSVPDYTSSDSSIAVHAFIYADHTVIQLDSYSSALTIKDDSGGTIGFTRNGRYARLDGKLNHFTALVNGEPVVFTRRGWEAPRVIPVAVKVADVHVAAPVATASAPAAASAAAIAYAPASAAKAASAPAVASAPTVASAVQTASAPAAASGAALGLAPNEKVVAVPAAPHAASAPAAARAVPPILASKPAAAPVQASAVVPAVVTKASPPVSLDVATVTLPPSGAAATAAAVPSWTLRRGRLVSSELREIGGHFGWHVEWFYPREVVVPADTTYSGDFQQVATQAITTLKSNGLLINAKFWEGNKTLVVRGAGTMPQ
ncbi:TcpQ domain-containing protein [Paraburkholderia largidicola]|nr:TcpQ domain-containing protein [Paraburkholderia sp. PGU16]